MRIISSLEYAGTRAGLETHISDYLGALEAHKFTVDEPAPLPASGLVYELARSGEPWALESEQRWAWSPNGPMQLVSARPAFEHELAPGEHWADEDPSGKIWDGTVLRWYTEAELAMKTSCTARQARLALHAAGLLANVEAAIAAAGGATAIEWEYASTIERASPLVSAIAAQLGLTSAQLDALFEVAVTL